jgi:hypothetical protein
LTAGLSFDWTFPGLDLSVEEAKQALSVIMAIIFDEQVYPSCITVDDECVEKGYFFDAKACIEVCLGIFSFGCCIENDGGVLKHPCQLDFGFCGSPSNGLNIAVGSKHCY